MMRRFPPSAWQLFTALLAEMGESDDADSEVADFGCATVVVSDVGDNGFVVDDFADLVVGGGEVGWP